MKILILSDGQSWIVDRISKLMQEYLKEYQIDVLYCSYVYHPEREASLKPVIKNEKLIDITKNYDIILFNNAPIAFWYKDILDKITIPKVVYIRSHRFIPDLIKFADKVDLIITINYSQIKEIQEKGVTTEIVCFYDAIDKSILEENKLVAGFVGQPTSYKGCDMIAEACQELEIRLALSIDRRFKEGKIDRTPEQMFDYYRSIDVYICMSEAEGTSLPVLEAYASGVNHIISTKVGSAYEILKDDKRLIWINRNKKELKEALLKLKEDINPLSEFSWENLIKKLRIKLKELSKNGLYKK